MHIDFDIVTQSLQSYINIKNKKTILELPFLSKKNRVFYIDNIVIPENFLLVGENIIYIFDLILSNMEDVTLKNMITQLKLFEFEQ